MKKVLMTGVSFVAFGLANAAIAADTLPPMGKTVCDPYKKYSCLDSYLGDDFITRFVAANPRIRCSVQLLDRFVDLVDEGVDVGIRIGALEDSSLVALRLGEVRQVVVASPQFLRRHGTPQHPSDLRTQPCVRLAGPLRPGWAFQDAGRKLHVAVDGPLDFNHAGAALLACEQGAGFGQFFSYQVQDALREKRLRIVLADFESPPQPVSIVYPHARLLPARTRAFIETAKRELAPLFQG